MNEHFKQLESYLAKKIEQYRKDHERLDIIKAPKAAILRLEREEHDIRAAALALSELQAIYEVKNELIQGLQWEVRKKDHQMREAQKNVDCIMEGYKRMSESEDKMLTWIMKRNGTTQTA